MDDTAAAIAACGLIEISKIKMPKLCPRYFLSALVFERITGLLSLKGRPMAVLSFVVSHLEFYVEIQRLPLRDTLLFDAAG
ncbi:hypothetical protein ACE3MQ_07190 [Paenibacillus lentus]|uniref:hypothetical protein n=1 Tax=Paenibacillus lentus TaxID=1338368 RepID=UPI0036462865